MTTSDPVGRLLATLENVKPNGTGHMARCPGHDDRHNSLKVDSGTEGQALIHCHAGCEPQRVVAALGWTLADLYPPRTEPSSQDGRKRRIVSIYDYRDACGVLCFQAVRFEPKGFSQRRPDGAGGWVWNLTDVQRVLYRYPELLAADAAEWVLIPEGEKDVDRLVDLGFVATTNAQGAGKWRPEYTEALRGCRVVLLPDNDEAGEKHAATVVRALDGVAAEVRMLRLPNLPPKGDVSDWLDAEGTREALTRLIAETPPWQPTSGETSPRTARLVISSLADVVSQSVDWSWYRWLPQGKFHLFGGYAGDGKSTLLASLAATGSRRRQWPDGTYAPRIMRTLFLLGEDSAADTLKPRLALHDADMNQISVIEAVLDEAGRERYFNIGKHLDLLETEVVERGIDWIVIDPLTTIMPGTDRNAEGDTRDALTPLIKLADRRNVTITGVAHVGKSGDARRAAQKTLGATAFHALARVVWMVAPDEDERRVLGVVKSNLAVKPPSLVFMRDEDGPICWGGVSAHDVEDLLTNAPRSSPRADAEGFLREFLASNSRASAEVEQAAKAHGISLATLRRAADDIPVTKWKASGTHGAWYWRLPDGQPRHADPAVDAAGSNLLTPRDSPVSKLSKFPGANVLNGADSEHLHATTPIFSNGHPPPLSRVREGAQLAHGEPLGSEQVPSVADECPSPNPWPHATRHKL